MRPLAVVGDKAIGIEGFSTISPLSPFVPGFKGLINCFGFFAAKGAPKPLA